MNLPLDNLMLLSVVNTMLRDNYRSLTELCEEEGVCQREIISRLASVGFEYDEKQNAFK